ncbi:hypothetical protein [Candidatus Magnetaquiglobus chichijimensis]
MKTLVTRPSLLFSAVRHAPLWLDYLQTIRRSSPPADPILAAVQWLIRTSAPCDGRGFAHSLHFVRGWMPAYPETSGYLIPTLLWAAERYAWQDAFFLDALLLAEDKTAMTFLL